MNDLWHRDPERFRRCLCGLTRNAMQMIRNRRASFVAEPKASRTKDRDVVTDVDRAVQNFLGEQLRETFPHAGIIGEEGLRVEPSEPGGPYWTVDPLDGTMAFSRRALHGFSVMLSLVEEGRVIAACVGDVMTGVVYWFAPGQEPACREPGGDPMPLNGFLSPAAESSLVFGGEPDRFPGTFSQLYGAAGPFDRHDIDRGSIGLRFMGMFAGDAAGNAMRGGREWTPWDDTPLIGFSQQLGFRYLAYQEGKFAPFNPPLVRAPTLSPHPVLVVHESRLCDLRDWLH